MSWARTDEKRAQAAFADARCRWGRALEAHRIAPPDAGFSARLAALASAAKAEADACRQAERAGFEWPPRRAANSGPPYELRPGTGRRGPDALWQRFDAAVADLSRVATGTDLVAVADAYEALSDVAAELAEMIEGEDRASGLLPRARARRSA